jgi:hypothetical protein
MHSNGWQKFRRGRRFPFNPPPVLRPSGAEPRLIRFVFLVLCNFIAPALLLFEVMDKEPPLAQRAILYGVLSVVR